MINFIDDNILNYSISKSEKESKLLNDLYRETYLKVLNPRMISGHYQGRILSFISKIMRPKKILEIGTYTGYSAICLCEGLDNDGVLHTIDNNKELIEIQNKYFKKANLTNKIVQHSGDAKNILPSLDEEFNIVFIDADKESYPEYYDLIINKVSSGGIIIADNIFEAVDLHEPRAQVIDVDVNLLPDQNTVRISVTFEVLSVGETVTLDLNLARLR